MVHQLEDEPAQLKSGNSLASRTLRIAVLSIAMVSICVGAVSYYINQELVEEAVRKQLVLSTEQTLQRESLPFAEIKALQNNFLVEFNAAEAKPSSRQQLVRDFDRIFYRHADGAYTQITAHACISQRGRCGRMPSVIHSATFASKPVLSSRES